MTLSGGTEHSGSSVHFFDEIVEVGASEFPLEGLGDGLVVLLEAKQTVLNISERGEVVWGQSFPLDDGEVDLDLVELFEVSKATSVVLSTTMTGLLRMRRWRAASANPR
jgi:hypothetical protein